MAKNLDLAIWSGKVVGKADFFTESKSSGDPKGTMIHRVTLTIDVLGRRRTIDELKDPTFHNEVRFMVSAGDPRFAEAMAANIGDWLYVMSTPVTCKNGFVNVQAEVMELNPEEELCQFIAPQITLVDAGVDVMTDDDSEV